MKKTCFALMALTFCGCRQKPASQPTAPATAPSSSVSSAASAEKDSRPVIVCFGDSLTAGFGLDPNESYPALLQPKIDLHGYRYRAINMGVAGETTQDGLARIDMMLAERPAIVIVEFGANDGLRGQPVPHIQANLAEMIEAIQHAGAQVLLAGITLPPNYGMDYIHRFDAMYQDLAAKYKTGFIPFLLANAAGHANLMQRDGLHPNAEGTKIVAGTVWNGLEKMLKR
jgi:acyl-CoA thioesterase-1